MYYEFGTGDDSPQGKPENECLTINFFCMMKRVLILLTLALMSIFAEAKTVRGYVTDRDGNPVEGVKMVVMNKENPAHKSITSTDAEGYFSVKVPDSLDTSEIVAIFSQNGATVLHYRETSGGVEITIEPKAGKTVKKPYNPAGRLYTFTAGR